MGSTENQGRNVQYGLSSEEPWRAWVAHLGTLASQHGASHPKPPSNLQNPLLKLDQMGSVGAEGPGLPCPFQGLMCLVVWSQEHPPSDHSLHSLCKHTAKVNRVTLKKGTHWLRNWEA